MSDNILPDSRLQNSDFGNVVVDWDMSDEFGNPKRIRLTLQPIFCINCSKMAGYVPRDVISFASWLCEPCSHKWGEEASLHVSSDREFWDAVGEEMRVRFGKSLNQHEIAALADQGRLGKELELLMRESPYRGGNT